MLGSKIRKSVTIVLVLALAGHSPCNAGWGWFRGSRGKKTATPASPRQSPPSGTSLSNGLKTAPLGLPPLASPPISLAADQPVFPLMDPAALVAQAPTVPVGHTPVGFLFEVFPPQAETPSSHLLGTIHILGIDSAGPVARARLGQSKRLYTERLDLTDLTEHAPPELRMRDRRLEDLISPAALRFLQEKLVPKPFSEDEFQGSHPAEILARLHVAAIELQRPGIMDLEIQNLAREAGLGLGGLETLEDIELMFEQIDPDVPEIEPEFFVSELEQAELSWPFIYAGTTRDLRTIRYFYEMGDERLLELDQLTPDNREHVARGRNEKWFPAIQDAIALGRSFFAVGTGHLFGDDGLIKMLRETDHRVERVRPGQSGTPNSVSLYSLAAVPFLGLDISPHAIIAGVLAISLALYVRRVLRKSRADNKEGRAHLDVGTISNVLSGVLVIAGLLVPAGAVQGLLLGAGLFAFSGGVTNSLAIKMFFDRIPGVPGSGVIPNNFKPIQDQVKEIILTNFFDEGYLKRFLNQTLSELDITQYVKTQGKHGELVGDLVESQWKEFSTSVADSSKPWVKTVATAVGASTLGLGSALIGSQAVENAVAALLKRYIDSLKPKIIETLRTELKRPGKFKIELHEDRLLADLKVKVDALLTDKLASFTENDVQLMAEKMMRTHLAWLVVWGNVLGAVLGILGYSLTAVSLPLFAGLDFQTLVAITLSVGLALYAANAARSKPAKSKLRKESDEPPARFNMGVVFNLVSGLSVVAGLLLPAGTLQALILGVGMFAFSGGITNSLAIKMLFDRIPGVPASGVIPNNFVPLQKQMREMVITNFFDEEHLKQFLQQGSSDLDIVAYVKTSGEHDDPIADIIDSQWAELSRTMGESSRALMKQVADDIGKSSFGVGKVILGTKAVEDAVAKLVEGYVARLKGHVISSVRSEIAKPGKFNLELDEQKIFSDLRDKVDRLLEEKLAEFTEDDIKYIAERITRSHLAWLVVWGNVLGAILGLAAFGVAAAGLF